MKTSIAKMSKMSEIASVITQSMGLKNLTKENVGLCSTGIKYEQISLSAIQAKRMKVHRYYLTGKGKQTKYRGRWERPLSRGILLKLAEAKKTQKFGRFEIWELEKDPILVGFTKWSNKWLGRGIVFENYPQMDQVTYKICKWE